MPASTLLDIPEEEQVQILAALRRARYGYLLALHVLLLCAAGHNPTDIAAFLFCSRSSIYRIVRLYRAQKLGFTGDAEGQLMAPVRTTILMPWMKRSLGALLKVPPRTYGWCRTRWSCATLAAQLHITPCGRTFQTQPRYQGPARWAVEAYVPRLITSPSS